jgi:hypothetical protein
LPPAGWDLAHHHLGATTGFARYRAERADPKACSTKRLSPMA